jgi:Flp pilus assembly protein TadB
MSVAPASRRRRNGKQPSRGARRSVQHPPRSPSDASPPDPTRTAGAEAAIDQQVWQRTMDGLRRIVLLLSVALAAVVARIVIDGPELVSCLTGALIVVLLLCSLALRRQGRRLDPGATSETDRIDPR